MIGGLGGFLDELFGKREQPRLGFLRDAPTHAFNTVRFINTMGTVAEYISDLDWRFIKHHTLDTIADTISSFGKR